MYGEEQAQGLTPARKESTLPAEAQPLPLEEAVIKAVLDIILKHRFYFINEESCSETLHNLPEALSW